MSELADRERLRKQHWAAPGGSHDNVVRLLKLALPVLIGVLMAYLALAPLSKNQEISFILDKNKVAVAKERMRVEAARYRGQDDKGRPFTITAESAVQATSRDPIVDVLGMMARLGLESGPATIRADQGRYNLETETVTVTGPVLFTAADGYRIQTRDVAVDLDTRTMESDGGVEGRLPLGRFSANRMSADLEGRTVTLTGNARLHIVQGGLR
ncbi:LPS export ABC transporter periplasmic protein LptC [Allosphingosinicella sp.]|uniref:LPS export ABC transporter periplasmic protein LptC n=1 Tax=Allosphingosinicella sp. TaxID=2823234 RepID=UPI002FC109C1